MIPKVEFVYSFIYDKIIVEQYWKDKYNYKKSHKRISNFIKKVEPKWRKIEKKVLSDLSKLSGLKWDEPKIKCYITTHHFFAPFSEPLTIGICYGTKAEHIVSEGYFLDILIHELIHQLFIQQHDSKKYRTAFWKLANKHKGIWNTKIHVLLHALLAAIIIKYFNRKMLEREIEGSKRFKQAGYYEAWQIVEKEGYKNIIAKFRKYLKKR